MGKNALFQCMRKRVHTRIEHSSGIDVHMHEGADCNTFSHRCRRRRG